MSIELLAKQGRDRIYGGLASIDSSRLRQMRDPSIRTRFSRFDEADFRLEYVARIYGMEFINDAAGRSVNATWYALQRLEGSVIWIAFGGDTQADYARLQSLALSKVRMLICVGGDSSPLHQAFQHVIPTIIDVDSIGSAVHAACYSGLTDVKVLFSPATRHGLSDRTAGLLFRREVNEL
ncbi:MAG: hypothetical protein J5641_00565 [Bacteroidales bacterium]|nr:hypothetical protein [Bacteroidales bacterium]